MSKQHKGFNTLNYNRFTCNGCGVETVIEPGQIFDGNMNCECKGKKLDDTEISTPVQFAPFLVPKQFHLVTLPAHLQKSSPLFLLQ